MRSRRPAPSGGRRTALVRPARSHPPRLPLVHQDHQFKNEPRRPRRRPSPLIRATTSTTSVRLPHFWSPRTKRPFLEHCIHDLECVPAHPPCPRLRFRPEPPHLSAPRPALEADLLHSVWKRPWIETPGAAAPPPRRRPPAPANCTPSRVLRSLIVILEAAPRAANERRTRCSGRGRRLRGAVRRFGGRSKRRYLSLEQLRPARRRRLSDGGGLGGASCTKATCLSAAGYFASSGSGLKPDLMPRALKVAAWASQSGR